MTRAHCNGTRMQQRNSDSSLQSHRTDAKMLTSYLYYLSPCPGRGAPVSCRWYQHLREDQATGVLGSHTQTEQCSTGGMARGTRPACHRRWGFCASKCLSHWWLSVLSTLYMCQAAQSEPHPTLADTLKEVFFTSMPCSHCVVTNAGPSPKSRTAWGCYASYRAH